MNEAPVEEVKEDIGEWKESINEAPVDEEEEKQDLAEWKESSSLNESNQSTLEVERTAKRAFVGAGARVLFYPTLLYNVVRNKLQSEFRWWDEIHEHLLLGAVPFPGDVPRLKSLGVGGVVTLNESYETLVPSSLYQKHKIDHLVIPTRDYLFAPSLNDIRRAVQFIHEHVERGETTYVHCKAGRGRSTTVVLCYLVEHQGMTPADAFKYVQARRPRVLLASAQWQAVQEYSRRVGVSFDPQHSWLVPTAGSRNSFLRPITLAQISCSKQRSWRVNFPLAKRLNPPSNFQDNYSSNMVSRLMSNIPGKKTSVEESNNGGELDRITEGQGRDGGLDALEEVPVVVTSLDLAGYRSIEDAGVIGNDVWRDLGLVYRVRLTAARNFVSAAGAAKASMDWARVSCLFLGCPNGGNQVLSPDPFMTSNVARADSLNVPTMLRDQVSMARYTLPLCQAGMVNG